MSLFALPACKAAGTALRVYLLGTVEFEAALALQQDPKRSVQEICEMLHISQATFYRYINAGKERADHGQQTRRD